ncbi:FAD-binding oxidoreductase, partial [Blautia pseudococcoides]|nr:FAD-binding oxidoreductase [Blautia pseudococcoides]
MVSVFCTAFNPSVRNRQFLYIQEALGAFYEKKYGNGSVPSQLHILQQGRDRIITEIQIMEAAMTSLWMDETKIQSFPELTKDITADVAVVGGGMTGILTAHFLSEQGMQVVVLEADRVGGGQTGKTTAKITSQHGVIYQKLLAKHGEEAAGKYAAENQKA